MASGGSSKTKLRGGGVSAGVACMFAPARRLRGEQQGETWICRRASSHDSARGMYGMPLSGEAAARRAHRKPLAPIPAKEASVIGAEARAPIQYEA